MFTKLPSPGQRQCRLLLTSLMRTVVIQEEGYIFLDLYLIYYYQGRKLMFLLSPFSFDVPRIETGTDQRKTNEVFVTNSRISKIPQVKPFHFCFFRHFLKEIIWGCLYNYVCVSVCMHMCIHTHAHKDV